ncbi:DinB family protein [Egibacter rhizosphaerae]|uniref:DinB family protein n=1 Tax=Egibacter rhizosphaerae TaxID=1670831 RepID=A0A411YES6_9ACTN|nr:DinB family protein [Egibacter rhizosphaerae]QBI19622.1 DinB family protein [Egibacter rhizosphaerae]
MPATGRETLVFDRQDLSRSRFRTVRLNEARFHLVDLRGARFDQVVLDGAVMRGADLIDVEIDGEVSNLVVNGVDVAPLIEAELDRRDPERRRMRPTDPDGFREAWDIIERRWDETVARARGLDPALLHASVDGEWSFIQTMRHLVFATDAWVRRAVLGQPRPWDPLGLPHTTFRELPGVPNDPDARPSLDQVLALRQDRMQTVRQLLDGLTQERLDEETEPVTEPGYPEPDHYPVRGCVETILEEEWRHREFAERDLAVLQAREGDGDGAGTRPGEAG